MNSAKRKSSVKINPLKGRFFDIKPPVHGLEPPPNRSRADFWRFFFIAFLVFLGLNLANIYTRGRDLAQKNQEFAIQGYSELKSAITYFEKKDLKSADISFKKAEKAFTEISDSVNKTIPGANQMSDQGFYLDAANKLIESGIIVADIGQRAIELIEGFKKIPEAFMARNIKGQNDDKITSLIHDKRGEFRRIMQNTIALQQNLTTFNTDILPQKFQDNISEAQDA